MTEQSLRGRFTGTTHSEWVRVYYADTDAGGVVYHAKYLAFAEQARTETLRAIGLTHGRMKDEFGIAFAVRGCKADFLRPARLDDLVEVRTDLLRLAGATLDVAQSIWLGDQQLVTFDIKLACVSWEWRPTRVPAAVRDILRVFLKEAN